MISGKSVSYDYNSGAILQVDGVSPNLNTINATGFTFTVYLGEAHSWWATGW